jgi:uncharacterized protein (UPF0332 family)
MKSEAWAFLGKAQHALHSVEVLLAAGEAESAVGRAYYAMLHSAQALLGEKDLRYRKHGGVHAAFGMHFAKTGLLDPKFYRCMLAAFNARVKGDYDIDAVISIEAASATIEQAREFLQTVRRYLEAGAT